MTHDLTLIRIFIVTGLLLAACDPQNSPADKMENKKNELVAGEFPWTCDVVLQAPYGSGGVPERFVRRGSRTAQPIMTMAEKPVLERAPVLVKLHDGQITLILDSKEDTLECPVLFYGQDNSLVRSIVVPPMKDGSGSWFVRDAILLPGDQSLILLEDQDISQKENCAVFVYEKSGMSKLIKKFHAPPWSNLRMSSAKKNELNDTLINEISYGGKNIYIQNCPGSTQLSRQNFLFGKAGGWPNGCAIDAFTKQISMSSFDAGQKRLALLSFNYNQKAKNTPFHLFYTDIIEGKDLSSARVTNRQNDKWQLMWEEWYTDKLWCSFVTSGMVNSAGALNPYEPDPKATFHVNIQEEIAEVDGAFYFPVYGPKELFLVRIVPVKEE